MDTRLKQYVETRSYKSIEYKIVETGGTFINVFVLQDLGRSHKLSAKRGDADQVAKEFIDSLQ